jgi:hypothetical protein
VALRRDDAAASPLTVIVTFVVVAVLLTVAIYALFFDKPEPGVGLVAARDETGLHFDVTRESGGLEWGDLTFRLLDRGGMDVAPQYIHAPAGSVDPDDRVDVSPLPPGGTYLLLLLKGDDELSRLSVDV